MTFGFTASQSSRPVPMMRARRSPAGQRRAAAVLALLKIASYLDNPELRAKDLDDLKRLLRWYEQDSPRVFSDAVLEADLPDVEFASAFLLGLDVRGIADDNDHRRFESFLVRMKQSSTADTPSTGLDDDWTSRETVRFGHQLA